MANFTYEGIATRSIDFDPAADTLTLNLTPAEIANVSEDADGVKITTVAGFVLTLSGVTYAELAAQQNSIVLQNGGDFLFSDGTTTGTAVADVVVGTEFSDVIDAAGGNNLIFGGRGQADADDAADNITAGNGNDTIYGNGGNDVIASTGGNDVVYGGLGEDNVSLNAQAGQTVTVYGGSSEASSTDTADTIRVSSDGVAGTGIATGNALVFGNGGADNIQVYANGNNSVYGGFGDDQITVSGAGNNLIVGGADDNDRIVVNGDGDNTIFGGQAEAAANDLNDTIIVTGGGDNLVYGNGGDDNITVDGGGNNSVYGGLGVDRLVLDNGVGDNLLVGGTGTNTIIAETSGNTTIYGGSGEGDSADLVTNVTLDLSGSGKAAVYTNAGADIVGVTASGTSSAQIFLGQDNDQLVAQQGAAGASLLIYGGAGEDNIDVRLFDGSTTIYGGNGEVDSADLTDVIQGGGGSDLIYANGGDDQISTGAGADTIYGGAGDDQININGLGDKTIGDYTFGEDSVTVTGASVAQTYVEINTTGNDVTFVATGVGREITFLDANDDLIRLDFDTNGVASVLIRGAAGADSIDGAGGNDFLLGGAGNDTINGLGGTDLITGQAGNDSIDGGAGNDSIAGGVGVDTLAGGAGDDTFSYANGDTTAGNFVVGTGVGGAAITPLAGNTFGAVEVITDLAGSDVLNLGNSSLAASGDGTLSANEFLIVQGTYSTTTGLFTVGAAGTTGADSLIIYDQSDAAGVQQGSIVLVGVTNAEEGNIVATSGSLSVFG